MKSARKGDDNARPYESNFESVKVLKNVPHLYPVMLNLQGRSCVIIGGGRVAARKAQGLLDVGARVTVISPAVCAELQPLIDKAQINLISSNYTPGILPELQPTLVFTTADDEAVNQRAADEAHTCGAIVNRADSGDQGDFENMISFRRGTITLAVSTAGASPALARHLSEHLQASLGDEYSLLAEWMAAARPTIRASILTQTERAALWQTIIQSPVLDELRQGNTIEAKRLFDLTIAQTIGRIE